MTKQVAIIPLRLGSKRVPKKNLRILRGKPLCSFIIEAVIESGIFNKEDIYINSESLLFKEIADYYGISFYLRSQELSTDSATNDDFVLDFLQNVSANRLFQFLATSPLLSHSTILDFCIKSLEYSTFISIVNHQIECIFQGQAVNFGVKNQTQPSQSLVPVASYACSMMSWDVNTYLKNSQTYGAAYHGGNQDRGFYPVVGLEQIDIDQEEDFEMAEMALEVREKSKYIPKLKPIYWNGKFTADEVHVPDILKNDGVMLCAFADENKSIVNVDSIIDSFADEQRSWIYRAVNTNSNSACLITQMPGDGNRLHMHPDWDEFWLIIRGSWLFQVEEKTFSVSVGDLVLIPRLTYHRITATGCGPATRLAVSRQDVVHSYPLIEYS